MSYAIIRNENYKLKNLSGIYRHNERKNSNYSNKNINKENSKNNYSIKAPFTTYEKMFKVIKQKYDLKGQIKSVSNVMCEFIITSDKEFFSLIGKNETKRFFQTAYNFVKEYKNLGEEFIVSAKVHMDENTPHMHLVFIPVIHKLEKKSGKNIHKIACSEYWKGKNSYRELQDNFYSYMVEAGFNLERGNIENSNEHIEIGKLKKITDFDMQEMFKETNHFESEVISEDIETIRENYKKVIKKYNTLASRYTKVKSIVDDTLYKAEEIQKENDKLKKETKELKNFIEKTFECVNLLFNFPIDNLKRIVKDFYNNMKGRSE